MDDLRTLVIQARDGDPEAFGLLARLFRNMARRTAAECLGDHHLAEDAAQEALVAAYLELPSLREPAAFRNWLRRLVLKHCDRIRRRPREPAAGVGHELRLTDGEPAPDERLELAELRARLQAAVASLPEHEHAAARLFYWDGLSLAEAGRVLQVPAHTVKSRLFRARQRLKETLMAKRKTSPRGRDAAAKAPSESHPLADLLRLPDPELKLLLFTLPYDVLVDAFAGAPSQLLDRLVRNLPARGNLPRVLGRPRSDTTIPDEIARAKLRARVDGAREQVRRRAATLGQTRRIGWPPPDRPRPSRPLSKRYERQRAGLEERLTTALHLLTFDEVAHLLLDLSTVAETESWFVLEPPADKSEHSFVRAGVWMIVDGTESDLVLQLLETWRDALLRHHELTMDMAIAGLLAVAAGDNPLIVQFREQACYRLEIELGIDDGTDVDNLKAQLQRTPHAHMSLDERAVFMAQLGAIARREGILELRKLLGLLGDDYLELGVKLLVDGAEPQTVMEVLEARKQTLMDHHRTRYRMVIEGLLRIQAGERTGLVETRVRSLY